MGLRYVSSESSRFINILEQNLIQSQELLTSLTEGSYQIAAAVDGHHLSGAAYTAAKNLFVDLIIPTIQKTSQVIDEIKQELQRYRTADATVCGESVLDEDELKRKIEILKSQQILMQHTVSEIHHQQQQLLNSHHMVASILHYVDELFNLSQQLTQMANQYGDNIRELERKLKLLQDFGMATQGLFEHSLSNLQLAMQAVTTLNLGTLSEDGHFHFPMGLDRSWLTEIKSDYPQSAMVKGAIKSLPRTVSNKSNSFLQWHKAINNKIQDNGLSARMYASYKVYLHEVKKPGFLAYGQQGQRTFDYLTKDYKKIKKWLHHINPKISQKLMGKHGLMHGSFNKSLNKFDYMKRNNVLFKYMNKLEGVKGTAWRNVKTLSVKTFKASEWFTDTGGKVGEKIIENLPKINRFSKSLGKIARKSGWLGIAISFGFDTTEAYYTDLKNEQSTGRRIGKAVVHGAVDQLKSAGPIEGAIIGAGLFGPWGALGGFTFGVVNTVADIAAPKLKNKMYNSLQELGDNVIDNFSNNINQIGKIVNKPLSSIKYVFGIGDLAHGI